MPRQPPTTQSPPMPLHSRAQAACSGRRPPSCLDHALLPRHVMSACVAHSVPSTTSPTPRDPDTPRGAGKAPSASRTSSTELMCDPQRLLCASKARSPEPSPSSAQHRRRFPRPVKSVSSGSRFYANVVAKLHREQAAAMQAEEHDLCLAETRARQEAPRRQRERREPKMQSDY